METAIIAGVIGVIVFLLFVAVAAKKEKSDTTAPISNKPTPQEIKEDTEKLQSIHQKLDSVMANLKDLQERAEAISRMQDSTISQSVSEYDEPAPAETEELSITAGTEAVVNSNVVATRKILQNRDLLYVSDDEYIPELHRGIYFEIHFDANGKMVVDNKSHLIPDPSTIYVHLPIQEDFNAEPMPYWPHYIEMTPRQRYKYLEWLRDVERPIDMGYVFIYYYGLERKMLTENFDKAFDEIIKLRNFHTNKSFLKYSENALIHGAILCNRIDRLLTLQEKTEINNYSNALFLIAYNGKFMLDAMQLLLVSKKVFALSRKDIKTDRELFTKCISDSLMSIYGNTYFDITKYEIDHVPTVREVRFANYSFSEELRGVEITDFYQCRPMMEDLEVVFKTAHEYFKKARRKEPKAEIEVTKPDLTLENEIVQQEIRHDNIDTKDPMIPISDIEKIPNGHNVVYASEVPEWINIGNLIFEKKYEEAINLGNKILEQNPMSAGAHINLMGAYFKARNQNKEYYDLSTYHAKKAIICGHNTGYAHKRLVINLEKDLHIHQAIQLCDLVLSKDFHFSEHGCGWFDDYEQRKMKLLKKLDKSIDSEDDILFTEDEIKSIFQHIQEQQEQDIRDKKRLEEITNRIFEAKHEHITE